MHPPSFFLCHGQGEGGQNNLAGPSNVDTAIKNFEKKFKDKTKNNWSDRDNFVSHAGKYTLIEVEGDQDAEVMASQGISIKYNDTAVPTISKLYIFSDVSTKSNRQPHYTILVTTSFIKIWCPRFALSVYSSFSLFDYPEKLLVLYIMNCLNTCEQCLRSPYAESFIVDCECFRLML